MFNEVSKDHNLCIIFKKVNRYVEEIDMRFIKSVMSHTLNVCDN